MANFKQTADPVKLLYTGNKPKILFSPSAIDKIEFFVQKASGEISWVGEVYRKGETYHITEIHLLKQTCSAVTTDITETGLNELAGELLKLPDGIKRCNALRFWGHSHVEMGVSPSGTDNSTMESFGKLEGVDYFIRGIFNKKGDIFLDFHNYIKQVNFENPNWSIDYPQSIDREKLDEEFKQKVADSPILTGYYSPGNDEFWDRYVPEAYKNDTVCKPSTVPVSIDSMNLNSYEYRGMSKKERKKLKKEKLLVNTAVPVQRGILWENNY